MARRRPTGDDATNADPTRSAAPTVTVSATDPARRLTPVVRLAPAKLNLSLAVVGRRPDGYHELHSVMVRLGLADRLSLAPAIPSSLSKSPTRSLNICLPDSQ